MLGPHHSDQADASLQFIDQAFSLFETDETLYSPGSFGFLAPSRVARHSGWFGSEVTAFLPILDQVDADIRQRVVGEMCPALIECYGPDTQHGYLIFTPVFADMWNDLGKTSTLRVSRRIANDAAALAARHCGVDVAGLGGILPRLTGHGRHIDADVLTTTGHAGTVHLIQRLVKAVLEAGGVEDTGRIGIIGAAGSIGRSALTVLGAQFDDFEFVVSDRRKRRLASLVSRTSHRRPRVRAVESNRHVLEKCSVVVSAVTSPILLSAMDHPPDLSGTIVIDDSQPACFDRSEVEEQGGRLLWVAGCDRSPDRICSRVRGYNYGSEAGLLSSSTVWGCEAEAACIGVSGRHDLAVSTGVDRDAARRVGALLDDMGIAACQPQSFGRPVCL